jgi:hypothetical protein
MRRWLPVSITSQTTLGLIIGMLAVLIAGATVSSLTLLNADGRGGFVERIVALAAAANKLPPAVRSSIIETARDMGFKVRFADQSRPGYIIPDAYTDRLKQRLNEELAPFGISDVVVVHVERGAGGESFFKHLWAHRGPILARIQLSDEGSTLRSRVTGHSYCCWVSSCRSCW